MTTDGLQRMLDFLNFLDEKGDPLLHQTQCPGLAHGDPRPSWGSASR